MARSVHKRQSLVIREIPCAPALAASLQAVESFKATFRSLMVRKSGPPARGVATPFAVGLGRAAKVGPALQGMGGDPLAPGLDFSAPGAKTGNLERARAEAPPDPHGPDLQNPTCTVWFDANRKLTAILGAAQVRRPVDELAAAIDPRSWGKTGGIIARAYPVEDHAGHYDPRDLGDIPLGEAKRLKITPRASMLLYEYAQSEIASFENILEITSFTAEPRGVFLSYQLYDCLLTTFGFWTAPGGLTVNEGYSEAVPIPRHEDWSRIEVLKRVKVRDLTPNESGNPYDYGESINATMGAALSQWVDNVRMMSPIF